MTNGVVIFRKEGKNGWVGVCVRYILLYCVIYLLIIYSVIIHLSKDL